jgi:hypothetical protein
VYHEVAVLGTGNTMSAERNWWTAQAYCWKEKNLCAGEIIYTPVSTTYQYDFSSCHMLRGDCSLGAEIDCQFHSCLTNMFLDPNQVFIQLIENKLSSYCAIS